MPAIYYLTRFTDLPSIRKAGALISSSGSEQGSPGSSPLLSGEAIRQRRQMRRVENLQGRSVAAGGVVADYVSLRFTHRSGCLDAITRETPEKAGEYLFLVAHAETVVRALSKWCFTDGHAIEAVTNFFDDLADLQRIDWDALWTTRSTGRWLLSDPDVIRRQQAEFLVARHLPWSLIGGIAVSDEHGSSRVKRLLARASHKPKITIEPQWFTAQRRRYD
jgi:hypothetical protein